MRRCSLAIHCVAFCDPSPAAGATAGCSPGDAQHLTRSHPTAPPWTPSLASPLRMAAGCLSPLPTAAPIPSIADTLLLCYDASSPRSVFLAAATGLPTVRIRTITALIAWCCAAMERRLSQASTFQLPLLSHLRRKACQSASGGRHRIESAWMHSHLPHTISLTPLLFCCATPLRLYSYRSAIPIPALLDHRTEGTQQVAPLTTSHREAPLAAFTTHIL